MNKWIILFVVVGLMIGLTPDAEAQRRGKRAPKSDDELFDDPGKFKDRLWYGGGFNLGFSGNQNLNIFNLGISPMVGYKLFDEFSIGPRLGLDYSFIKGTSLNANVDPISGNISPIVDLNNQILYTNESVAPISFSFGLFARYKVLDMIFAHVEFGTERTEQLVVTGSPFGDVLIYDRNTDQVFTSREWQENLWAGIGYTSGGLFAFEIYLLYNFLEPQESVNLPFDLRVGFTYRF